MNNKVKGENISPLLIFYDIETNEHGLPIENDNGFLVKNPKCIISCICAITETGEKFVKSIKYDKNKPKKMKRLSNQLINKFRVWCRKQKRQNKSKHYILVGWNNKEFDNINIGVKNRDTIDLMKLFDKYSYNNGNESLDSTSKKYLTDFHKITFNPVQEWMKGNNEDLEKYCLRDVELLPALMDVVNVKPLMLKIMDITGCKFTDLDSNSKIMNCLIPETNPKPKYAIEYEGGFNFIRKENIYETTFPLPNGGKNMTLYYPDMLHIDVKSLYPSIMKIIRINRNFKYPNIHLEDDYENDTVFSERDNLPVKRFVNQIEIDKFTSLPETMDDVGLTMTRLLDEREENKKLYHETGDEKYNINQLAFKILANSLYGLYAYPNANFYYPPLAVAITYIGREILKGVGKRFEAEFGKTDSIWIPSKYTVEEVNEYTREFIEERFGIVTDNIIWEAENNGKFIDLYVMNKNSYLEVYDGEIITAKGVMKLGENQPECYKKLTYDLVINDLDNEPDFTWESYIEELINQYPYAYQWGTRMKLSEAKETELRYNEEYLKCADEIIVRNLKYNITGSPLGYIALPIGDNSKIPVGEWFVYKTIEAFTRKVTSEYIGKLYKDDYKRYNNRLPSNYKEVIQKVWFIDEIPEDIKLDKLYWKDYPEELLILGETDNSYGYFYQTIKGDIIYAKDKKEYYKVEFTDDGIIPIPEDYQIPSQRTSAKAYNKKKKI